MHKRTSIKERGSIEENSKRIYTSIRPMAIRICNWIKEYLICILYAYISELACVILNTLEH